MSQPAPSVAVPAPASALPPVLAGLEVNDPLFHLLFTQSPLYVGILEWVGEDARYLAVNPATAVRLGRPASEIRGRFARELGLPRQGSALWGRLGAEALRRGAPVRAEWEMQTERGLECFRSTVVPLASPEGAPPRFAYLTEDLTRLKALEVQLSGTESPSLALVADVEQPLASALHVLDVAGDEVENLAATHPELELSDAAEALRDGIRNTRRAHQKLRDLLLRG